MKENQNRPLALRGGMLVLLVAMASFALATPSPLDYTDIIDAFKVDLQSLVSLNGGAILSAMLVILGFVFVIKWMKRTIKGS